MDEKILRALRRRAKGFTADESVSERVLDARGRMKVVKKWSKKRHFPPDVCAIKLLAALDAAEKCAGGSYAKMSDGELAAERDRILLEIDKYLGGDS